MVFTPFSIFNCVFDGTIYGRGKTIYMLVESIATNGVYYVTMFILWKVGVFVPTLTSIALMFGIGTALDLIPTIACYIYLLKKEGVRPALGESEKKIPPFPDDSMTRTPDSRL